jgi:hypothetical protein
MSLKLPLLFLGLVQSDKLLLELASTVIDGSESCGAHESGSRANPD